MRGCRSVHERRRVAYGDGGGAVTGAGSAAAKEAVSTSTRRPLSNESMQARASCRARRPALACTGGALPALKFASRAATCLSNVR